MRKILIATGFSGLLIAGAGTAHAASIEEFEPTGSERTSVMVIGCPACEAARQAKAEQERLMPPGTSVSKLREVDGEMKVYTTQNWLGGSPVTIVRKATGADLRYFAEKHDAADEAEPRTDLAAAPEAPVITRESGPVVASATGEVPAIDTQATSALPDPVVAFDPSKYELRLN